MSSGRSGISFKVSKGDFEMKIKAYFYMLYYDFIAWRHKVDKWRNLRNQSKQVLKYTHPSVESNQEFWIIIISMLILISVFIYQIFFKFYYQIK